MAIYVYEKSWPLKASKEVVWRFYQLPEVWPIWNKEIKRVEIAGPFVLGALVILYTRKGFRLKTTITKMVAFSHFRMTAKFLGAKFDFSYVITKEKGQEKIMHRLSVKGFSASLFNRFARDSLTKSIGHSVRELGCLAERHAI